MVARDDGVHEGRPGALRSYCDLTRFRVRLIRYSFRYRKKVAGREWLNTSSGLVGVGGPAAAAWYFVGAPTSLAVGLAALIVVAGIGVRRRTSIPALLDRAAECGRADELRGDMARGMRNPEAFAALERVYAPVLESADASLGRSAEQRWTARDSQGCAALTYVLPAPAGARLDDVLEPEIVTRTNDEWMHHHAPERQRYMNATPAHEQGDNLVAERITLDPVTGAPRVQAAVATYGQIVRTCDAMLNEFAVFAFICADRPRRPTIRRQGTDACARPLVLSPRDTLACLPWRRAAHRAASSPADLLLAPTDRAAGIGVAVAMVDRAPSGLSSLDNETHTVWLAQRSNAVGTYQGAHHVLPAGMCNTRGNLRRRDARVDQQFLRWTMLGELLEECYDEKSLETYRSEDWVRKVRWHCAQRQVPDAAPRFTGLVIDLLTLRPEVCATVDVRRRSSSRPRERFELCWEYEPRQTAWREGLSQWQGVDRTEFVQSGLACLALAAWSLNTPARSGTPDMDPPTRPGVPA